jgi:hypothetical protein
LNFTLSPGVLLRFADTPLNGVQLKIEDSWSFLVGYRIIDHSWRWCEPLLQCLMVAAGEGRGVIFRGNEPRRSMKMDGFRITQR